MVAEASPIESRAKKYPGLDFVRLGAALLVAFYHLGYLRADRKLQIFSSGWVGVEIFFVISGFVIAFSADGKSIGRFAKSRVARLYPAAFICSTIIVFLNWLTPAASPLGLMTYLRSVFIFPVGPWVNQVFWTLPVEMAFYSLIGISLWRRWPLTRVALWLGCYSCAFWVFEGVNALFHLIQLPQMHVGKYSLLLLHYGVFFALGMLLYARKHLVPALVFICVAFFACAERGVVMDAGGSPPFVASLIWLSATLLIVASIFWNDRLQRLKSRTVGLATYPLYLVHSAVGMIALTLLPFPYGMIVGILLALVVACGVLPLETLIRRLFAGVPAAVSQLRSGSAVATVK